MTSSLRNLGDILRLPALGERLAYVDLRSGEPVEFTAIELDRLIVAVARGLMRRGIRAGERVGIVAENRFEFIAAYCGAMRMGAVAVPVNFKLPANVIQHVFRDSEVRFAFADTARAALIPTGIPAVDFDSAAGADFQAFLDHGALTTFEPGADDLAEILYTSGSTGLPKGVPLTHRGQLAALSNYCEALDESLAQQTALIVAPLYHMNGLFFTSVALTNRITVISLPRFEARRYLETAARYRCTVLSGIPTMFALAVRESSRVPELDLTSVQDVSIGSAPLTGALLEQVQKLFPNASVHNGFGTTEAGPAVFGEHPDGIPTPPLSLGYPIPGIGWRLVDGPSADEGVLALRTPALMSGYLNLPQVTAARMRDGWYVTGDIMRRDANGFFYFVGRSDDMFVCGGENIYPGEIENLLERHPLVAQALVVPAPDDIKGQIPVAFIVPRPGAHPSAEEIKSYALERGPAYAHPRFVVFREDLPLSGTHKIDRSSLVKFAAELTRQAGRST